MEDEIWTAKVEKVEKGSSRDILFLDIAACVQQTLGGQPSGISKIEIGFANSDLAYVYTGQICFWHHARTTHHHAKAPGMSGESQSVPKPIGGSQKS